MAGSAEHSKRERKYSLVREILSNIFTHADKIRKYSLHNRFTFGTCPFSGLYRNKDNRRIEERRGIVYIIVKIRDSKLGEYKYSRSTLLLAEVTSVKELKYHVRVKPCSCMLK